MPNSNVFLFVFNELNFFFFFKWLDKVKSSGSRYFEKLKYKSSLSFSSRLTVNLLFVVLQVGHIDVSDVLNKTSEMQMKWYLFESSYQHQLDNSFIIIIIIIFHFLELPRILAGKLSYKLRI